jgi:hypothetical protein
MFWVLDFDKRTGIAEILGVLSDGVTIVTSVAGIKHEVADFLLPSLFPQLTEMQPMSCRIFTLGFHGF